MVRGKLIALVLTAAMLTTSSACLFASFEGYPKQWGVAPPSPLPSAGTTSVGQLNATEYLTSISNPAYSKGVWNGSATPETGQHVNTLTRLNYSALVTYGGFSAFVPGVTSAASASSTLPAPNSTNASGWLSNLRGTAGSLRIPGGNWTFHVGLNISEAPAPVAGQVLYAGVYVFVATYSSTNGSYYYSQPPFHGLNTTFNLVDEAVGNYSVAVSFPVSSDVALNSSQYLFCEYFLSATLYTPSTNFSCSFAVGGPDGQSYNFTYPDFGWINGSASPSNAIVSVDGSQIQTGAYGTFNITASPSVHAVTASSPGYTGYSNGSVAVSSGIATSITIGLSKLYSVDFQETGLPPGTQWSVDLSGSVISSKTASIGFLLVNGTYSYITSTIQGYQVNGSSSSTVKVAGQNVTVSITFSQVVYSVEFSESGLPVNTIWKVQIANRTYETTSSYIGLDLPNGSYNYSIPGVSGYVLGSGSTGNVKVNGSIAAVTLLFTPYTFHISFTEVNLPLNTRWSVSLGGEVLNSTSSTIDFYEPNGTYQLSVSIVPGYKPAPLPSKITVSNASQDTLVVFSVVLYHVTFYEFGLSNGVKWSVTLGGVTVSSTAPNITFSVPNGTYSFTVGQISGFKGPSGTPQVTVSGADQVVPLSFSRIEKSIIAQITSSTLFFPLVLSLLVAAELAAGALYFRKRSRPGGQDEDYGIRGPPGGNNGGLTLTQMLESKSIGKEGLEGIAAKGRSEAQAEGSKSAQIVPRMKKEQYAGFMEGGNSYAVFEQTAAGSMDLFEAGIGKGYLGLCFTRQYPERIRQRLGPIQSDIYWLTNIGGENSIRPKDLEKITLQCNEHLTRGKSVILIDGLEYLITNNGFITVLKLLQSLRDSAAVGDSILVLTINPAALGQNEVSLIMREVDKIIIT